jgi:hypothetical protein
MNLRSYCIDALCFRGSERCRSLDVLYLPWHCYGRSCKTDC